MRFWICSGVLLLSQSVATAIVPECKWETIVTTTFTSPTIIDATLAAKDPIDDSIWYWTSDKENYLYEKSQDGIFKHHFEGLEKMKRNSMGDLQFDQDGAIYFKGSSGTSVWKYVDGEYSQAFVNPDGESYYDVKQMQLAPDGKLYVLENYRVQYIENNQLIQLGDSKESISQFAIDRDGDLFVTGYDAKLQLWDKKRKAWKQITDGASTNVLFASKDGRICFLRFDIDCYVLYIYNKETNQLEPKAKLPQKTRQGVRLNIYADNTMIINASTFDNSQIYYSAIAKKCFSSTANDNIENIEQKSKLQQEEMPFLE